MNGKLLISLVLPLLPALAQAQTSAADYIQEEPLTQGATVNAQDMGADTEVLTPKGILSEDDFTPALEPAAGPLPGGLESGLESATPQAGSPSDDLSVLPDPAASPTP